ncbi:hypothetical protein V6N13_053629 [Hibiscus sabdariffa]|uniref:Polygalacturonase n=1 Tax=Hibiscus sabdariffa TaxID=183260 RepID=A0ABR2T7Z3_9ROSI
MKFVFGFTLFLLTGCTLGNEILNEKAYSSCFNVMDYGAVGDGKVDDSQAFNETWEAVCSAQVGDGIATLVVPQGKTFLLYQIKFQGPCQAKSIHFQLGGTLVAPQSTSWGDEGVAVWIQFSSVENLILDGGGTIDGQGSIWWEPCMKTSSFGFYFDCNRRPTALHFNNCNGLRLEGLTHLNSPMLHISINACKDVTVSNLHIKAPKDSPNTDGIDIAASSNVQIQDSTIGTDQFYQDKNELRSNGILQEATAILVSDVTYSYIQGTSASDRAINLDCDKVVGCSNIVMNNVQITRSGTDPEIYGYCNNANGTAFNVQPKVPCLS